MAGFVSTAEESRALAGELADDPYLVALLGHLREPDLYAGDPAASRARQEELLRPFLEFFLRHDNEDAHYHRLYERKGLLDAAGTVRSDVGLHDLVALRIHSDDLRGERGQRRRLTKAASVAEADGKVFTSSGTTGNEAGPVTIVRSPLQLHLMHLTMGSQMERALGFPLADAAFLMHASPEMRAAIGMPNVMCGAVEALGGRVHLGARLNHDLPADAPMWRKVEPDVDGIRGFLADPAPRKIALIPPPAVAQLLADPELVAAVSGGPPHLDLGAGGVLMSGGGLKRTQGFTSLAELLTRAGAVFRAGADRPAPVFDALGLTESASCFPGAAGDPADPATWVKVPHPLSFVGMLHSPQRLELVDDGEFGEERLLFFVNLMCVDYLEAVVPGDVVVRHETPDAHQHGFTYVRRAGEEEGFAIREGCG